MDNHEALIEQIAGGDKNALAVLYGQVHERVYYYIFSIVKDEVTAQDILADTFVEIWKSAKNFKGLSKGLTWIFGIARNLSLKSLRSKKDFEDIDEHYELKNGYAERFTEKLANVELVEKALEKLSWKHREVIDLAFFQELSYEEISKILSIPVNTVKTRVFHAKKALKNIIMREVGHD